MMDLPDAVVTELVDANHILFDQGVVDGFGHISLQHPTGRTGICWRAAWRQRW